MVKFWVAFCGLFHKASLSGYQCILVITTHINTSFSIYKLVLEFPPTPDTVTLDSSLAISANELMT